MVTRRMGLPVVFCSSLPSISRIIVSTSLQVSFPFFLLLLRLVSLAFLFPLFCSRDTSSLQSCIMFGVYVYVKTISKRCDYVNGTGT